jgi:gamma-glutamylcyclotransferase (GGCT)/AIG2-like uncharacterized protein YtfP
VTGSDGSRADGADGPRAAPGDAGDPRDGTFCLFVYGTLRSDIAAGNMLGSAERLTEATVEGTLYDLVDHPALMLYGSTPVHGEVWRCPLELLVRLDEYEGTDRGLFRRVAVTASGIPCWAYVAGAALASRLTPDRRMDGGRWTPADG